MNYKVGDDVTDGKSTGTIIAINGEQLQVRWTSPSEYDGTSWISSDAVSPVHNCENCRHNALDSDEEPCLSCGDGDDNNWEAPIGTAKAAQHYIDSAMQPIEFMQTVMTPEQFRGFCIGNVVKYLARAPYKQQEASDKAKALQYAYWADLAQQGRRIDPTVDVPPQDYEWKGI